MADAGPQLGAGVVEGGDLALVCLTELLALTRGVLADQVDLPLGCGPDPAEFGGSGLPDAGGFLLGRASIGFGRLAAGSAVATSRSCSAACTRAAAACSAPVICV